MKKIVVISLLGIFYFSPLVFAYNCSLVDGVSIFGYNWSEYEYIGSVANPFNSKSIANEFGTYGNPFSSNSMFNEFGTYGNPFGSYSAFNNYSFNPPIMLDQNLNFIGYVTTNEAKTPRIHPDVAKYCANESFANPISSHEDLSFKNLDDLGSDILNKCYAVKDVDQGGGGSTYYLYYSNNGNFYYNNTCTILALPNELAFVEVAHKEYCSNDLNLEYGTKLAYTLKLLGYAFSFSDSNAVSAIKESGYCEFKMEVSDSSEDNPLGLQPGWLIKNKKFAEVFSVDSNLCLHWVVNEKAAERFYGSTWNHYGVIKEFDEIPMGYEFCKNIE